MEWFVESSWKTVLSFAAVMVYARILGKEQISQLTFYDYVTGITFGNLAGQLALSERSKILEHFWILTLFVSIAYFLAYITTKSRPLRKIIEGEPTIVIHNGKILEQNMGKMRYNMENLLTQLRQKDIFDISDVEFAILETNGVLSVLKKSQKRSLTPEDLNLPTRYEGLSTEIIVDGKVIYPNLEQNNLDEQWLIQELQRQGINSPREVFFASLESDGTLYIDKRKDDLQQPIDITDSRVLKQ
ncbi:MAG: DUF421 domain-containing protein [Syntrophomonadaceae bacterium]|nr:DUF421 domain-containing protein [Syntrophomonadaceae bacterium]